MMANSFQDWFKKWWLWLVVGATAIAVLLLKILAAPAKTELLVTATEKTGELKEQKAQQLAELDKKMSDRAVELKAIQAEPDEAARLKKLSDFANQRDGK